MKNLLFLLLLFPATGMCQSILISTPADTICSGSNVHFTASYTGITSPHFQWQLNGANTGTDSIGYTSSSIADGDTVTCMLENSTGDTIFAQSNKLIISVQTTPNAGIITGHDTICQGATTILSDTVTGGTWSALNTNASVSAGVVTGLTGGPEGTASYDSVFYTVTNACGIAKASVQIRINGLPDAGFTLENPPTFGISSLCVGQSVLVNGGDGANGMLYSKHGYTSYDIISGILNAIAPGKDTLICINVNACGIDTFTMSFTVHPLSSAGTIVTPKNPLCIGDTIALSDTGSNAPAGLMWNTTNKYTHLYTGNGNLYAVAAGIDTITATNSFCGVAKTSITITVDPVPLMVLAPTACIGAVLHLADTTQSPLWSSAKPAIAIVDQHGTFTAIAQGTDTIQATIGGCTTSQPIIVNTPPATISGPAEVCKGDTVSLSDLFAGTWSSGNTTIAVIDAQSGVVSGISAGTSVVSFTNAAGCSTTQQMRVADCQGKVSIFPNPALGQLLIDADYTKYDHFTIYNAIGQKIVTGAISQYTTVVNTEYLASGMYLIWLSGPYADYRAKFVKE